MKFKALSLLLITLMLSACGWHLRGVTPLPPEFRVLHLSSSAGSSFNQQLTLQLEFNDVLLTQSAEDAQAVLSIKPIEIEKRTLSLTSSGQIAEYELNALLTASVRRNHIDSEYLIELKARRHLRNDINNITGTANAEKNLILDIERDLANKLMIRLQRLDHASAEAITNETE